jgi:hypothetical protein
METKSFNICDPKNYKNKLEKESLSLICLNLFELTSSYFDIINSNLRDIVEKDYKIFIIMRGFETIIHCFRMLLLYTKNLELTLYHCKKAYIYYTEFIGQIGVNNLSFLQLSSRDATIFVYKKTLFDINIDFRSSYQEKSIEKEYFDKILSITDLYLKLFLFFIKKNDDKQVDFKCLNKIKKNLDKIIYLICSNKNDHLELEILYIEKMISLFLESNINSEYCLNIMNYFIKKLRKRPEKISVLSMTTKLKTALEKDLYKKTTYIKLVNSLLI